MALAASLYKKPWLSQDLKMKGVQPFALVLTAMVGTLASESGVSEKTESRNSSRGATSYLSPSILVTFPTSFQMPLVSSGMKILLPLTLYRSRISVGSASLSIAPTSSISTLRLHLPTIFSLVTFQSSPSSFSSPSLSIGAERAMAIRAPVLVPAIRSK